MKFAFSVLSLFFSFLLFGQNYPDYKVTYKLNYKLNVDLDAYNVEYFDLITKSTGSVFLSQSKFYHDSINNSSLSKSQKTLQHKKVPRGNFQSIVGVSSKGVTTKDIVGLTNYVIYEDEFPSYQFTNEEKLINGFNCKLVKANYSGRTWNLWYTEEIPLTAGPYKFHGLPGLVIYAADNEEHYIYSLYKYKPIEKTPSIVSDFYLIGSDFEEISLTEYIEIRLKAMSSWSGFLSATGVEIANDDPQEIRNISSKMRKKTNFIEL
ncbi:GLPGLI family protein [Nonlabens antarcticus]|uniref:GLPGLI family protein n=1 Tax=Nonlabens antarcticus TaxID=392714 RepID=UPI00189150F1|nr:GLPGLI family protein [Nonlabens antarcticus]